GVIELAARALRRRNIAYVITNQRCFRITNAVWAVHLTEVERLPEDPQLAPEALVALHEGLATAREPAPETRARAAQALVRELPPEARATLEGALLPGEQLLWAERPTAANYPSHAPIDGLTTLLVSGASAGWAIALCSLTLAATHQLPPESMPLAAGATATAAGLSSLGVGYLCKRIRTTLYAVTN